MTWAPGQKPDNNAERYDKKLQKAEHNRTMASKQEDAGMDIRIHPLVVMSVADAHTRNKVQYNQTKAIGALFGVQLGRQVQIYDSVEMAYKEEKGQIELDHKNFEEDVNLFKEVFPNYECLGWYATGKKLQPFHAELHEQMMEYNDRPLFMLMESEVAPGAKDVPISIYEQEVHVVEEKSTKEFVKTSYKIQADEPERISAVHCAKVVVGDHQGSQTTPHLQTMQKSVATLRERVQVLRDFLRDYAAGKVEADHTLLRSVRSICNRLPTMDSSQFSEDFLNEYNDALMVTYLASVTKGTNQMNQAVDKFNTAHGMTFGRGGRGGRGMMHPGMMMMGMGDMF